MRKCKLYENWYLTHGGKLKLKPSSYIKLFWFQNINFKAHKIPQTSTKTWTPKQFCITSSKYLNLTCATTYCESAWSSCHSCWTMSQVYAKDIYKCCCMLAHKLGQMFSTLLSLSTGRWSMGQILMLTNLQVPLFRGTQLALSNHWTVICSPIINNNCNNLI